MLTLVYSPKLCRHSGVMWSIKVQMASRISVPVSAMKKPVLCFSA